MHVPRSTGVGAAPAAALNNEGTIEQPPHFLYVRRDSDCGRALEVCMGGFVGAWVRGWVRLRVVARAAHTRHTHKGHLRFRCLALCPYIQALAAHNRCGATTLSLSHTHTHTRIHTHTRTRMHEHTRTHIQKPSPCVCLSLAVSCPFLTLFPRLSCSLNKVLN